MNPYFPSVLCESQNYLNSKAFSFTAWVAAVEISLVVAVTTKWQGL